MGNIASTDARALFTKTLVDVYQERIKPTNFLRAMFKTVVEPTKEISIEVERMGEYIAPDTIRGTDGLRVTFSNSTEKNFVPPFYRLFFDATNLDLYDRVLGSQGNAQAPLFAALLNRVSDRLGSLQDMIDRSTEVQCSQVLQTGIVTLLSGDSIDYRRKTLSIVDPGVYWDGAADPFAQLTVGCQFLRQVGKSSDVIFRAVCGELAMAALLNNTIFKARQNLFNMALDQVAPVIRNAEGSAYHGTITCGGYRVELWTYPQSYDVKNPVTGVITYTKYINDKLVTLVPSNPRFKLAYAAVPQLVGNPGDLPKQGQYVLGEWIDMRKATHEFDISSAPLAIPVAVDQIWTSKVLA